MADGNYGRLGSACYCGIALVGSQTMYCSRRHSRDAYKAKNPERVRELDALSRQRHPKPQRTMCAYHVGYCADCGRAHGSRYRWAQCPPCARASQAERKRVAMLEASMALHRAAAKVVQCDECGFLFCPLYGSSNATLCQCCVPLRLRKWRRIHKSLRRARMRGAECESVDPFRVFDRDSWKCRLCGVKTPKAKRGTYADNAPELDHILPLSRGGAHTYVNTQCVCRKCNQSKSGSPLGQMLLFG